VPVFVRTTVHWLLLAVTAAGPAMHAVTRAVTCAELVNDPNRPKTNPAMATAAMRVMAMRMTVARTGEIAFLRLLMFNLCPTLRVYDQTPENGTEAPLLRLNWPIACEPTV